VVNSLKEADLRELLDGISLAERSDRPSEGLPEEVLSRLYGLVPCDWITFSEFDPWRQVSYLDQSLPSLEPSDESEDEAFWQHFWDSLACSYPDRTGDIHRITTFSDFYSDRELHATGIYADYFRNLGVEREAMVCLSAPAGRTTRLLLFRGPGRDFDDRDRLVLTLLRPRLNELYQELERRRHRGPQLTARQVELLRLVARGHTNAEIAVTLCLSKQTVRKHLENIFARLGVSSRTAAVTAAFPMSGL
jgi:DNA-binding CsgD family transcriptional regulator